MTGTGTERLIDLRFPARADRMAVVRPCVRSAARMCGFGDAEANDIVLAVAEACQNVIVHGYRGEEGDIVLGLEREPGGIAISVTDFAPSVDPEKIKPRNLDEVRPGGLGTHFLRELMDTASFEPGAGGTGNVLVMTRKRRRAA